MLENEAEESISNHAPSVENECVLMATKLSKGIFLQARDAGAAHQDRVSPFY